MRLVFYRGTDGEVAVKIKDTEGERDFSYTEMIQWLYENKNLEDPEFSETVSDIEQEKLKAMIEKINMIGNQISESTV